MTLRRCKGPALVLVPGQTPRHFLPHVLGVCTGTCTWTDALALLPSRTWGSVASRANGVGTRFVRNGPVPVHSLRVGGRPPTVPRPATERGSPFGGFPVSSDFRVLATLSSVSWEGRHPGDEVETGDVGVRNWCLLLTLGVARDSSGSCVPIGTQGESPRRSSLRCGYGGDVATQCWLWGDGAFGTNLWGTWFGHSTGVGHHYSRDSVDVTTGC